MISSDHRRQLSWLMSLRIVILTVLLVCTFGIELFLHPTDTLRPLLILGGVAYGMVILFALLGRFMPGSRSFILLQLIGDALVITFFVQITGGLNSPMSFLYLLPISIGSILLYRSGGLALAGICWTLYAGLIGYGGGWAPFGSLIDMTYESEPGRFLYLLVSHLVAMLAFALLSSFLSERLRIQSGELVERQRAVDRLKVLNENIIGSINSGLITTDLHGRINFLNRGGAEILGFDQSEVEGQAAESFLVMGENFLAEIRIQLLARRRFRFERYFDRGDGRKIFLGIAASNLHDKTGLPLGYLFIFQDLTEIHALENEVRLNERMVALGEMAAGMAHELRNPLAAMSGAVQFLKGEIDPRGESLELMDIIMRESQRLEQTIRDFLTFARPGKFNPVNVDLVKLIDDYVKLLRKSSMVEASHSIETCFSAPVINCDVDPNRIKQIFWNLATNALKAMPVGGALRIEVNAQSADEIELNFIDEGVGMSGEQRSQYFQPFSGSFDKGTGLGAAIVYRLIDEHGGKIQLDSSEGEGTRVSIVLPQATHKTTQTIGVPQEVRAAGGSIC